MAPCEPQAGPNLSNLEHSGSALAVIRPEQVLERVGDLALSSDRPFREAHELACISHTPTVKGESLRAKI